MHKNKTFPNIYWIYIKKLKLLKEFSSLWQSFFTIYNSDSMFLLTVYFLKVCPGCISPCSVSVINIGMYVKMIQWQKRMFTYVWPFLIFLAILLSIYLMCPFQHRFSSSNTPRNFKHFDRSISLLFIFNFGKRSEILCLLLGLWKNEDFDLLTFSDSLFEINHSFFLIEDLPFQRDS